MKTSVIEKSLINYSAELNPEQYAVVTEAEGPCLVLAGAGSGKTRTLIYRVAYLLDKGINPQNILLVTFTNKAAKEMLERIEKLLGMKPQGLWGGTFHRIGNLCLRKYAGHLGYTPEFSILDREDSKDLVKLCIKEMEIDKGGKFPKADVAESIINFATNSQQDIEDAVYFRYPHFKDIVRDIKKVAALYAVKKKASNSMDFDDLLTNWLVLLSEVPEAKKFYCGQFRYILVDEYQDTNRLQFKIIKLLSDCHKNILAVGDDAQSIYSFRAAEIRNILDFSKEFPGTRIFKLETNYRSTPEILRLANESIRHNKNQYHKKLRSLLDSGEPPSLVLLPNPGEEANFIVQKVSDLKDEGVPLNEMAVLFRARYQSVLIELELQKTGIPYIIRGGVRFFEQAHIKDVLSYLKMMSNPKDELSWMRALRLHQGIGDSYARKIWHEVSMRDNSLETMTPECMREILSGKAMKGWCDFLGVVHGIISPGEKSPSEMIREVIRTGYDEYLQVSYEDAADRLEDLKQLMVFAGRYSSLEEFLSEVTLQEGRDMKEEGESLILSTIHQAKGLEWHTVIIIGMTEGQFPHPKSLPYPAQIEEERRLFYVAMTRTKSDLYITCPAVQFNGKDGLVHVRPSMFTREVPMDRFQILEAGEEMYEEI